MHKHIVRKAFLFLAPAVLLVILFYTIPMVTSVFYSFTDKALVGAKSKNWGFVGFQNYKKMFSDQFFWISLKNTIVLLVCSAIIGQQVVGFFLAQMMEKANPLIRKMTGLAVLLGWVTPEVVVSFIFFAFFNKEGSVNSLLGIFGFSPIAWLYNYAMLSVIIANIWRGTAFSMLMFQSALDNVDTSIKEAAVIDGAGKVQLLTRITLPLISGAILTNTILITLQTLGLFGLIYALTGGGPGFDTTTLPIYMYNRAFSAYQLGYGTAMAIILLLFGIGLSLSYMKSMKKQL
ncbi:carbohydrate ABC transporter permease [Sphaerochaeta halotolerans]|uniref:carbohydrate ABC transporter permease n=1 Tax=Sphaerochaeta halotolerans TaxID=2293840 RepID=UPI00136D940F|nr:sugar ABC transporter permease [Sphaerochaeta halotolerans]MDK2859784.1 multiple sugar transport system permease protein [Sphaerochaeta sp.]MXI86716.1 ABC transporter permease subunit [Sphaerochaeta halotolerans]